MSRNGSALHTLLSLYDYIGNIATLLKWCIAVFCFIIFFGRNDFGLWETINASKLADSRSCFFV